MNLSHEIIKGQIRWYQWINEPFKAMNVFKNECVQAIWDVKHLYEI